MSRAALVTKAEAKRLAEAAKATGCAVEVEREGKIVRFVPVIPETPKAKQVDEKGRGYL
jgi:hypothetical protein